MRKSVPCSFGEIGYSRLGAPSSFTSFTWSSYWPLILPCSFTVPTTSRLVSCCVWSACAKSSGDTSPLNTTACTTPLPSRTSRKWSLPLERLL